jgi:GNAT superfamily N-acetyltransferase
MTKKIPLRRPVALARTHDLSTFDCGDQSLNEYLRRYAFLNHQNRSARTYVVQRGDRVVGYYTLAAGSASRENAPRRVAKGLARYPVPLILLARLAVDVSEQGRGLGAALLKDAILRAARAADIIGCRAILTHAKDERVKAFYLKFGFEPSPVDELHLYLLITDIKKTIDRTRE